MFFSKILELLLLLAVVCVNTDRHANRDELAARRFRELNPETVQSDLDKSRNKRWHTAGFWLRVLFAVVAAAALGFYRQSWLAFGIALVVGGAATAALFDVDFNVRLKLPWSYLGSTSVLDKSTLESAGGDPIAGARRVLQLKLAALAVAVVLYLVFV